MNCPRQTTTGTIAASSMATLLQKNCIKTLTVNNGGVMVNATSNGNSVGQPTSNTGVVGTMQTHTITGQPLATAAAASRVLLPHELGTLAVQSQPTHQTFQFHQQLTTQQQQQQHQPQYIFYNNANLSNSTTFVTQQNIIPKPSSLGAIQYNNSSTIANVSSAHYVDGSNGATTAGPIIMTGNKTFSSTSQPKLNQTIAANTYAAQTPISSINSATPTIGSNVAVKIEEISSQSDGIQRNGITSITDNNNSNYSPTTSNRSSSSSTTIQTNDIKHTTSTNNLIAAGSIIDATKTLSSATGATMTTDSGANATIVDNTNEQETEPEPEIDIVINNVVCSFSVRCHLNLREIALNGRNVEFRRENGMVTMKLRRPYTTASIWSSGRITCTGATSEDQVSVHILFFCSFFIFSPLTRI